MTRQAPALADQTVLVANPAADLYGSDRMMLEAVRGLLEQTSRVIVTCSTGGPLVPKLRELGVEVHITEAPIIRKSMLRPRGMVALARTIVSQFPRMRRLIRTVDADVVIANTLTLPFWTLAARSCRRPVVVYVHEAESSLSSAARILLTSPLRWASGVVFNSETSRTVCRARGVERAGHARVVYNGIEGPPSVRPPRDQIDGPARLVYIGRLSPRKGADIIIEAAALLRDQDIHVTVDLVGDVFPGYEWYEERLRARITDLELDGAIRFLGFQDHVWEAIGDADLMVVPSRGDESFGNVVVESLLSARPVIVADHTGLREAAAGFESALRVAPEHPEAIAAGVREVLDGWDRLRAAAIRDAETARARFGASRFQEEFVRAIGDLTR